MDKFKKWGLRVLKVIGILLGLYLIICLFGPSDYRVEREKEMTASPEVIYSLIGDFNQWDEWSPWVEKDPTLKNTRSGDPYTVGHKTEWEGDPDLSGTGSMTFTELVENEKLVYDLVFDETMESVGAFELIKNQETVTVKWHDEGEFPFLFRGMALFMDFDAMMGPDFERGLVLLDSIATIRQEEMNAYEIQEIDYPGGLFYGVSKSLKQEEIDSTLYSETYGQLIGFTMANGIEMAGMPVSINVEWDHEAMEGTIMPALPVSEHSIEGADGVESYIIPPCKALVVDYYGEYDGVGPAYAQMMRYAAANGYTTGVSMEEYVTDPTTVESQDEVLTRVYLFLE